MPPGLYAFFCYFLSRVRRALWPQNFTFQAYCFQAHFMFQTGFAHHSQSSFGMWRFRILHWVEPLHFWILDSQRCVPSLSFPQYVFAVCVPFEWSPNCVNANKFKTFTHRQSLHIVDSTTFNWSLGLVRRGYISAILHKLHIPDMDKFSCIIMFAFAWNNERRD